MITREESSIIDFIIDKFIERNYYLNHLSYEIIWKIKLKIFEKENLIP